MNLKKLSDKIFPGIAMIVSLGCAPLLRAEVRMPGLFSDNMVLQQGADVKVWGWADDDEEVIVTFRGQKVKTIAKDGKWMVHLKKLKPGGPDTLTIRANNTVRMTNVLVGDVWVCSGQSNMEFPLKNSFEAQHDIDTSANPRIRLFHVPRVRLAEPTNNVDATWSECNPSTVADFTAVGYYFGRELQKDRNVPIGLIESSWGGTPAEAWTAHEALIMRMRYQHELLDAYPAAAEGYEKAFAKFVKERAAADKAGKEFKKGAPNKPWQPSELYNGMIAPLTNYAIKGAIWYQGESNAGRAEQYRTLFPDMIQSWRDAWHEGDIPFLAVQLAPFMAIKDEPAESAWAELREAQLLPTKSLPNYGIAVITDVGDPKDIHPKKKEPVGARLAIAARGIAYQEKIVFSGPVYQSMKVDGNRVILTFGHVGKGLEARDGELKGFAVCGNDKKFYWAAATIDGKGKDSRVIVSSADVANPVAVRFGWADCPVVNLWNKDALPASPFRTDDFPMTTAAKD